MLKCVSARLGDHACLSYSIARHVYYLYTVVVMASLFCQNVVHASDLSVSSLSVHFVFIFVMCCLNIQDIDVAYVMERILGKYVCGMRVLLI